MRKKFIIIIDDDAIERVQNYKSTSFHSSMMIAHPNYDYKWHKQVQDMWKRIETKSYEK